MSVKHIPQESADFGASHGKTRSFSPKRLRIVGKTGIAAWLAYEAWGLFWAGPILWGMWQVAGPWMQAWLLLCVALSVVVPVVIWRKVK